MIAGDRVCDFCKGRRARDERHRLVWVSPSTNELVLAELCSRCAAQADQLLETYGGHGRDAISLTGPVRVSTRTIGPRHPAFGFAGRAVLYLLVAVAFFFVVTLITSLAR